MNRTAAGAVLAAAVLLASGCGAPPPAPTARRTAGGVTVTVTLSGTPGRPALRATFRPVRPGFHLYVRGVAGIGVPTRVSVSGALRATGPATADRPVRALRPAGLPVTLPVYPDGPVTLTLPVRRTGARVADVVVGYGACGAHECLMPVTAEHLRLRLR